MEGEEEEGFSRVWEGMCDVLKCRSDKMEPDAESTTALFLTVAGLTEQLIPGDHLEQIEYLDCLFLATYPRPHKIHIEYRGFHARSLSTSFWVDKQAHHDNEVRSGDGECRDNEDTVGQTQKRHSPGGPR